VWNEDNLSDVKIVRKSGQKSGTDPPLHMEGRNFSKIAISRTLKNQDLTFKWRFWRWVRHNSKISKSACRARLPLQFFARARRLLVNFHPNNRQVVFVPHL
jgi:hypothetical protein